MAFTNAIFAVRAGVSHPSALRAKHALEPGAAWGVNGDTGELADMNTFGIWEPAAVKLQTVKTAVESACMLLRIDDIVSGCSQKGKQQQAAPAREDEDQPQVWRVAPNVWHLACNCFTGCRGSVRQCLRCVREGGGLEAVLVRNNFSL